MNTLTSGASEPFATHGAGWYERPLDYQVVIYEADHESHVAKITMNRPERLNALSNQLRAELFHALKVAERDNDINVIILKGAGRAFSAGYDLAGGGMGGPSEPDFGSQYVGASHYGRYLINQYWQIWELSKIVIAQTHGYVLAGASELCAVCDLVVSTPDCQFGYPPMRTMAAPDLMWFPWLLPKRKAAEMVYTGDSITGQEALDLGMINYCVTGESINEFTDTFAKRVALIPWQMATLRKRSFQKAYELMGVGDALEVCALMQDQLSATDRVKEMDELMQQVPLREYLTRRDQPYRDYRTAEEAILERSSREGSRWMGVSSVTTSGE